MSALKRSQRPNTSRSVEGSKEFVVRCICCNDSSHKRNNCSLYIDALIEDIINFRKDRIRIVTTNKLLETNFGRDGMKKLMNEKLGKVSFIHSRIAKTYYIKVGQSNVEALLKTSREVMIRDPQAIQGLTGWDDPTDIATIRAYLVGEHRVDMPKEALVKVKKGRAAEKEEAEEPSS
jgi:hypothetical protein